MKCLSIFRNGNIHFIYQYCLLILIVCFLFGCSKTALVYVPPQVDLNEYGKIGIIYFTTNADPSISRYATQKFQEYIHTTQPGIRFIELGTQKEILDEVNSSQFDSKAIQKIGKKYNVASFFHGDIEYSDIKTEMDMANLLDLKVNVKTYINATLSAQLNEAASGAIIWNNSVSFKRTLSNVKYSKDGDSSFGMGGYHEAHKKLIPDMIDAITRDFRGKYVKQVINQSPIYDK